MLFEKWEQEWFNRLTPDQQTKAMKLKGVLDSPWFNLIVGAICGVIGMSIALWLT